MQPKAYSAIILLIAATIIVAFIVLPFSLGLTGLQLMQIMLGFAQFLQAFNLPDGVAGPLALSLGLIPIFAALILGTSLFSLLTNNYTNKVLLLNLVFALIIIGLVAVYVVYLTSTLGNSFVMAMNEAAFLIVVLALIATLMTLFLLSNNPVDPVRAALPAGAVQNPLSIEAANAYQSTLQASTAHRPPPASPPRNPTGSQLTPEEYEAATTYQDSRSRRYRAEQSIRRREAARRKQGQGNQLDAEAAYNLQRKPPRTAAPGTRAKLNVERIYTNAYLEDQQTGKRHRLLRGKTRIGRSQHPKRGNDIIIKHQSVSRAHAVITYRGGGEYFIQAARSPEGQDPPSVRVNGRRIRGPYRLENRDEIQLGSVYMRFRVRQNR